MKRKKTKFSVSSLRGRDFKPTRRKTSREGDLLPPNFSGKLSEKIIDLAESYIDREDCEEPARRLIYKLAVVGWNSSFDPTCEEAFLEMSKGLKEQEITELTDAIKFFKSMRLEKYPDEFRVVENYQLTFSGDDMNLIVSSKMQPNKAL